MKLRSGNNCYATAPHISGKFTKLNKIGLSTESLIADNFFSQFSGKIIEILVWKGHLGPHI